MALVVCRKGNRDTQREREWGEGRRISLLARVPVSKLNTNFKHTQTQQMHNATQHVYNIIFFLLTNMTDTKIQQLAP